ncbi:MAG: ribosomal protein S18-alanine N-acetyltransferase [Alphaproteobacteria bacterium]|nr:ribosomal protein S18-alanine N-acetyltransferase [Alphaproteobacteria bacterium]
MSAAVLRPVSESDAAACADVHAACFDKSWPAADIGALLSHPASLACAAERDGRLVGFVLAWAAGGESEILTLAVDPAVRRGGFGRALMTAAMELARAAGAAEMMLEVDADNTAAVALYAGLGFAQVGRRPGYYAVAGGAARDALVLRRPLLDT